jgi:UDP-N-acetylmuramyl tripeptide synthase
VTNLLGANLPAGLVAALANVAPSAVAALEVDEAWLGRVIEATAPAAVVLLNLSRDQLDRNNEVRTLANVWRRALAGRPQCTVIANADDPLVVWGAATAEQVVWVGAGQPWTADASGCPACGGRITFLGTLSRVQPGEVSKEAAEASDYRPASPEMPEMSRTERTGPVVSETERTAEGGWACQTCDFTRPSLDVWLDGDTAVLAGRPVPLDLTLPGRANRANATMALAAASVLGADVAKAAAAMATTDEVVGRYRTVTVDGIAARMLLAKNPAGWLEVLDVVRPAPQPVVVVINARIADGRDPSWLWDVPFERLAGRLVIASGERGRDLAVRLHYAEVEQRYVADPVEAVEMAAAFARQSGGTAIDVVANYTSFQTLRARLP